jgi:hypothetical protein
MWRFSHAVIRSAASGPRVRAGGCYGNNISAKAKCLGGSTSGVTGLTGDVFGVLVVQYVPSPMSVRLVKDNNGPLILLQAVSPGCWGATTGVLSYA